MLTACFVAQVAIKQISMDKIQQWARLVSFSLTFFFLECFFFLNKEFVNILQEASTPSVQAVRVWN